MRGLPDHIEHEFRVGEHRDVAAVQLGCGGAHALRDKPLQLGMAENERLARLALSVVEIKFLLHVFALQVAQLTPRTFVPLAQGEYDTHCESGQANG